MSVQQIVIQGKDYSKLEAYLKSKDYKKVLLVCGRSIKYLQINSFFNNLEKRGIMQFVRFSDFHPNPDYESVVKGVKLFGEEKCDAIFAVGGGSAMDVAKCIKLCSNMKHNENYLKQPIVPNGVELLAIPTTAGTGSEATRFAVIYYHGEKQSVADDSCIPGVVVSDASTLDSVPDYQRKVTMLDALCHGIESFWSINSTSESKGYSRLAIQKIMDNMESYLANESKGNAEMLQASNIAGKAINITQTTAGHAMCYKLTSLYGLAHGHAAALCISGLWPYMIKNLDKCIEPRGKEYLANIFGDIAQAMGCTTVADAIDKFNAILKKLELSVSKVKEEDCSMLAKSVNLERLRNHPIEMDKKSIEGIYHKLSERKKINE